MAPLQFEDVSKLYGPVTALRDVSLTVAPGQCHCVAGPNGSGKTTLGRIATGLTRPTSGTVSGPTDAIGYGFQIPRLYPSSSVAENLATFPRAKGTGPGSAWVSGLREALRLDRVAPLQASVDAGDGVVVSTHKFDVFADTFTHLTVFLDGEVLESGPLSHDGRQATVSERYRSILGADGR